jgi:hypothetical protein
VAPNEEVDLSEEVDVNEVVQLLLDLGEVAQLLVDLSETVQLLVDLGEVVQLLVDLLEVTVVRPVRAHRLAFLALQVSPNIVRYRNRTRGISINTAVKRMYKLPE